MTRSDASVDDALIGRLKSHFDDDAIIELTALIAFQNLSSKFNAALGVPPQGFCPPATARKISGGSQCEAAGHQGRAIATRRPTSSISRSSLSKVMATSFKSGGPARLKAALTVRYTQ